MSKTKISVLAVLLLGVTAFFVANVSQTNAGQPICIALKASAGTNGETYRYSNNQVQGAENAGFNLDYYCLTDDGIKRFGAYGSVSTYVSVSMEHEGYAIEFLIWNYTDNCVAMDDLGMYIKGEVLFATGSPSVAFSVYGHDVVGGIAMNTIRDDWWNGDYEYTGIRTHKYAFSGGEKWITPGYEDVLPPWF